MGEATNKRTRPDGGEMPPGQMLRMGSDGMGHDGVGGGSDGAPAAAEFPVGMGGPGGACCGMPAGVPMGGCCGGCMGGNGGAMGGGGEGAGGMPDLRGGSN